MLVKYPVAGFCRQLGTCSTSGLIKGGSWQDRRGQTMLIFCLLALFYRREVYLTSFSCPFPIEGSLDGKVCYSKARPICLTTQHTWVNHTTAEGGWNCFHPSQESIQVIYDEEP